MSLSPVISVIVPVYNVGPYVGECLDALRCQSYADFEAILVDDGSVDDTVDVCNDVALSDSRFCVVRHKSNYGQSVARNTGLDIARGRYIAFVDGDDCVHPRYLEYMMSMIDGADITSVGYSMKRRCVSRTQRQCISRRMHRLEALEAMLYRRGNFDCNVWGKLFRRDVLGDLRFTEGIIYEDLDFMARVLMAENGVKRVAVDDAELYFYRHRDGSTLSGRFEKRRMDVLDVTDRISREVQVLYPDLMLAAENRRFGANFNILSLMLGCDQVRYGDEISECWSVVRSLRAKVLADGKSRLKNRAGALLSYLGLNFVSVVSRWVKR